MKAPQCEVVFIRLVEKGNKSRAERTGNGRPGGGRSCVAAAERLRRARGDRGGAALTSEAGRSSRLEPFESEVRIIETLGVRQQETGAIAIILTGRERIDIVAIQITAQVAHALSFEEESPATLIEDLA